MTYQEPAGGRVVARRTVLLGAAASPTLFASNSARAQGSSPVVEVATGKLRGAEAGGVSSFKGIPYAASTAGKNRFLPPVPAAPWPGVRATVEFGASAPQLEASTDPLSAWYGALQPTSEDCLSLNVWAPSSLDGRRAVMVWLHGGAWVCCAGSAPGFDGTVLARDGTWSW